MNKSDVEVIERAVRFIDSSPHTQIAIDTMTNELRKLLLNYNGFQVPKRNWFARTYWVFLLAVGVVCAVFDSKYHFFFKVLSCN